MMNLAELNTIQGVLSYLHNRVPEDLDIDFDVTVGDSNGDVLGHIRRVDGGGYQFFGPNEVSA